MRPHLIVWSTAVLALASLALAQDTASEIPQFEASRVQAANDPRPTALSPGLLVSIYGSHLGPSEPCQGRPDPELRETPHPDVPFPNLGVYPKELCGVQVLVDGQPAGLLYVHADQINFKVPMTVPVEGTIGLRVTHGVRASELVEIPAGRQTIRISIPEPVFTNMPIWIEIQTPLNWHTDIRYPMGISPGYIGCNELELRKDSHLLEKLPASLARSGVARGFGCGGGLVNHDYRDRLPLHLLFRLNEPGTYEVRFNLSNGRTSLLGSAESDIIARSEWTSFHVRASTENQRSEWLAAVVADPPRDAGDQLGDYLPSILGFPDALSLTAVLEQLYHPHRAVRRYAELALGYWPQDRALSESIERTFEQRGPSDVVVRWLGARLRTQGLVPRFIEPSLPYLVSDDPVLVQGAITAVAGYHANLEFEDHPELKARVADAMLAAANRLTEDADRQAIAVYAGAFLNNRDVRAAPILWRWVDTGLSFKSALSAIIRLARSEDLPRMTTFITATKQSHDDYFTISHLISDIYEAYGAESIPYLVRALKETDSQRVRMRSARMLIQEDHPAAWAFVVTMIESGYRQQGQLIREINDLYPELNADESAILELARQRAARRDTPREGGTSPR